MPTIKVKRGVDKKGPYYVHITRGTKHHYKAKNAASRTRAKALAVGKKGKGKKKKRKAKKKTKKKKPAARPRSVPRSAPRANRITDAAGNYIGPASFSSAAIRLRAFNTWYNRQSQNALRGKTGEARKEVLRNIRGARRYRREQFISSHPIIGANGRVRGGRRVRTGVAAVDSVINAVASVVDPASYFDVSPADALYDFELRNERNLPQRGDNSIRSGRGQDVSEHGYGSSISNAGAAHLDSMFNNSGLNDLDLYGTTDVY